jgi:L-methionine (R)-S-oxide reductase
MSMLVEDVHAFPGHIACDAASRSELVVPLIRDGKVIGVIDLDSPHPARFDAADQAGIEAIAAIYLAASARSARDVASGPAWPAPSQACFVWSGTAGR